MNTDRISAARAGYEASAEHSIPWEKLPPSTRNHWTAITAAIIRTARGHVPGYCPMGCGESLTIGAGSYITCGHLGCPNPEAVTELLGDDESEHVVTLSPFGFTIRHPLKERLGDALLRCRLDAYLRVMDSPPHVPGRYRVSGECGDLAWEPLTDTPPETEPAVHGA